MKRRKLKKAEEMFAALLATVELGEAVVWYYLLEAVWKD